MNLAYHIQKSYLPFFLGYSRIERSLASWPLQAVKETSVWFLECGWPSVLCFADCCTIRTSLPPIGKLHRCKTHVFALPPRDVSEIFGGFSHPPDIGSHADNDKRNGISIPLKSLMCSCLKKNSFPQHINNPLHRFICIRYISSQNIYVA